MLNHNVHHSVHANKMTCSAQKCVSAEQMQEIAKTLLTTIEWGLMIHLMMTVIKPNEHLLVGPVNSCMIVNMYI